jgi:hypothetical protein
VEQPGFRRDFLQQNQLFLVPDWLLSNQRVIDF